MRKSSILLAVLPAFLFILSPLCASAQGLPTWTGSFTVGSTNYSFTMVGANPQTNSPTPIKVYIIPLKITFLAGEEVSPCTQSIFDPATAAQPNGKTVIQNVLASPIFDSTTQYNVGGVNVGTTQYADAFQRANFWGYGVDDNPNYHVILDVQQPLVAEQALTTPPSSPLEQFQVLKIDSGPYSWGGCVGQVDRGWFMGQLRLLVSELGFTPDVLPIFLTYRIATYGTSAGYHDTFGSAPPLSQTLIEASWNDYTDCFSAYPCYAEDVAALSHEVAEWLDDPFNNNMVPQQGDCPGFLEVADVFSTPQYYYPYTVNGFTYHLQDLMFVNWWGDTTNEPPNGLFDFQGLVTGVCTAPPT
ncbi:MAG TPA: hypothetical protein VK763_07455 [Terriglobales bacterium]|jgi:hypothetical protein|nr:hypothetical protein [Terriglobales bacterium]